MIIKVKTLDFCENFMSTETNEYPQIIYFYREIKKIIPEFLLFTFLTWSPVCIFQ